MLASGRLEFAGEVAAAVCAGRQRKQGIKHIDTKWEIHKTQSLFSLELTYIHELCHWCHGLMKRRLHDQRNVPLVLFPTSVNRMSSHCGSSLAVNSTLSQRPFWSRVLRRYSERNTESLVTREWREKRFSDSQQFVRVYTCFAC